MSTTKKHRLNLDFPPDFTAKLNRCVEISQSSSKTETIRHAITALSLLLSHQQSGGDIILTHPDNPPITIKLI